MTGLSVAKIARALAALHTISDSDGLDEVEREVVNDKHWAAVRLDLYAMRDRRMPGGAS